MLVQKKMEKKKILGYVLFILVMIAGTGFFVYKNYQLTSNKGRKITIEINKDKYEIDNELLANDKKISENEENENKIDYKEIMNNKVINLKIFNDDKFKILKKTDVKDITFGLKNNNPFQPSLKEEKE